MDHAGHHAAGLDCQADMSSNTVDINGKHVPVRRTSKHRLRTLAFTVNGRKYSAIEQNAEKPSR